MEALFWTLVLLSQVLGVVSVILLATWLSEYGGGYDWDCGNGVGSYHYLLLTIGMVFLYAEGKLTWWFWGLTPPPLIIHDGIFYSLV